MSDAVIDSRESDRFFPWHPYVTVEKYSIDQASWAESRLAEARRWKRLPPLRHVPLGERKGPVVDGQVAGTWRRKRNADGSVRRELDPHGDWLRELFPAGPEDGYAYDDGNLLTNQGLTNICYLLLSGSGASPPANANIPIINANTVVGVGATNTAATTADVHLGADGGSAYYQQMDVTTNGYPTFTSPATLNGQCTYASGSANFAWNEWCWATGKTTITAGATLSSVFSTSADIAMINHKVPGSSLGTKASGASWVFSTTIVFS